MSELRKYERVWFTMDHHPQVSEPEVFLAYDFADALAQSEYENKRHGQVGVRWVWEVRPHQEPLSKEPKE